LQTYILAGQVAALACSRCATEEAACTIGIRHHKTHIVRIFLEISEKDPVFSTQNTSHIPHHLNQDRVNNQGGPN
jgi:hypothetical protein